MGNLERHARKPTSANAMADELTGSPTKIAGVEFPQAALAWGSFLMLALATICTSSASLAAQISDPQSRTELKQWHSTTDSKSNNLLPERVPVRIIESHSEDGDRTLDKRSVEIRGTDGHFEPYQDIESETLTVEPSTVKTTVRTFARDVNGTRVLVQVMEEEKRSLSGDRLNIVRETFNNDVNGRLEPVQREIVEARRLSVDLKEIDRIVMLPSVYGGLAAAFKSQEFRQRGADGMVESKKSTWLPDVNGKWQLGETRQQTIREEGQESRIEERVFRPDSEEKLSQISRVVSRNYSGASEERNSVVETYSIDVLGTTRDDKLHLVGRRTSTERSNSDGTRVSEQKFEQLDSGDPDSGLHLSIQVNGENVPEPSGEQSTVTIRASDWNGSYGIVSVDTTKADRITSSQIPQTLPEQP